MKREVVRREGWKKANQLDRGGGKSKKEGEKVGGRQVE